MRNRGALSLPHLGLGCSWVIHSECQFYSSTSHYSVLGLSSDATKAEIKAAFVSLSKKYHPDKNPESDAKLASEKFSRINEAYSVLIDPAKRRHYDREFYVHNPPYHSAVKRDEKFDFYKYDPRVNAYTYARAYNYYDVSDNAWGKMRMDSTTPDIKKKNLHFLRWLFVICICGAALHSLRIHYAHKLYNRKSVEKTRKLKRAYDSVIENSKHSTVKQQLEVLRRDVELDQNKNKANRTKD